MPQNLYDSLLERMDGRPYSNYFACFCPFEEHKTPAMLVHDDGLFVCLSCGKKGTHKQLDRRIGSHYQVTQCQPSRVLPQWRKWEEKYDDLEGIVYHAHKSLTKFPAFQTYFRKRKIYEYVDEGHLGYIDGFVTFPVFDSRHTLLDIVVRSTSSHDGMVRYVVSPSVVGTRPLYVPSWDKVNQAETVYVVYGVVDAISLHLAGLPVVTGITGKSLPADLLRPLGKRFVIIPDADEEREAHKLANQLGWRARVKTLDYPDGCKDPDNVRREFGNQQLLQLIGA